MEKKEGLLSSAYNAAFRQVLGVVERDVVPDFMIRRGIRYLLSKRAATSSPKDGTEFYEKLQDFVEELKEMPVAVQTDAANEQHYEVPTEYFTDVLGKYRKYSCCLYTRKGMSLEDAEVEMLQVCCERAKLCDGQSILELGCGWGSLSLFMAEKYPKSTITAVSNSKTQKKYIDEMAEKKKLKNLTVITADVVHFSPPRGSNYDRVVSVEMFEHMKNYQELLRRISTWLKPGGFLFVHIFVHRLGLPYHYVVESEEDWMTKYFFAGGTMPSSDLLLHFQDDLSIEKQWYINGNHYSKTLEDWLVRHDTSKSKILPLFEKTYGKGQEVKWFVYWRLFYLACSELFAYDRGERWGVGHYLFKRRD
ncbi:hypothetical protein M9435_002182 [Picochlorum sp. BPE23]|nr:hypothetical protein M9435_002182 [Picochlorum sp. BPE23]